MNTELIARIKEESDRIFETVRSIRRHLHQQPELSFQEHKTAAFISNILTQHGIEHQTGVAGTGITGLIRGRSSGKVIGLRADMDALPIAEQNEVEYRSQHPGVMHACGHDMHTASLLGTVIVLNSIREYWPGAIKFLFQPGEEILPGGASLMIKEGVLEDPAVQAIFGQHVFPELEAGKVGFRKGMYMASTDELYLEVKGKGGHGGMPHQAIDTVYIAAQIIVGLQQIVSRKANPAIPTVLSFGKVDAPGATNVIPSSVKMEGTFRTFDEAWRKEAHELIRNQAAAIAQTYGGTCEVSILKGYPALVNNDALTGRATAAAEAYLGKENVVELPIRTTAEDFAFFSQRIPACFYRVGVRNEKLGIVNGVHHPRFDIDEAVFRTSVGLMAWMALQELAPGSAVGSLYQ